MVLLHLHKLLCSAVVFTYFTSSLPFVLDENVAGVCYLPQDVSNYSYTVVQMYSHSMSCSLYSHLSCSLSSSHNVSNGSPPQGLHMHLYT